MHKTSYLLATALFATVCTGAQAAWEPTKPIEFVVTSGPGGGTDNFARTVQSIVAKHKLGTGETPGEPLQVPDHDQRVLHILRTELTHERTAAGRQFQQPFARQVLERLPEGSARNAEFLAELAFMDATARHEGALDDHVANPRHDRIVKARTRDPAAPLKIRFGKRRRLLQMRFSIQGLPLTRCSR